jgi:hypothetical protein
MLEKYLPEELKSVKVSQELIPSIAKNKRLLGDIENSIRQIQTKHSLLCKDARFYTSIEPKSIHLVLTSPPYWTLKKYRDVEGQIGHIPNYEKFLDELDKVWKICFDALVPGAGLFA